MSFLVVGFLVWIAANGRFDKYAALATTAAPQAGAPAEQWLVAPRPEWGFPGIKAF